MHCRRRAAISSAGQLPVPAALDTHFPTLPDVDGDSIHPLPGICNGVRRENCSGVEPRPYGQLGGWYGGTAGRCGERTERCQRQRERSERVAAVKIGGARRKAAQKFWAPQQDHRPLRRVWGWCMGVTDCHSQCAHWLRNDMVFCKRCGGAGRCGHRSLRKRILWCVGEGLSCPPLCRPTDGHCRARQSGHFLETGLLHPPLAALRRFPRPRATARVAPTKRQGMRCKPGFGSSGRPAPTHRLPIELRREGVLAGVTDCHGRFAPSQ